MIVNLAAGVDIGARNAGCPTEPDVPWYRDSSDYECVRQPRTGCDARLGRRPVSRFSGRDRSLYRFLAGRASGRIGTDRFPTGSHGVDEELAVSLGTGWLRKCPRDGGQTNRWERIGHPLKRALPHTGIRDDPAGSRNLAAVALYRSAGFRETGLRKAYYRNGDDAIVMHLLFKESGGRV